MKLFCRYCWKKVTPILSINEPHIQADCIICKKWIKFLNKTEVKNALIKGIKLDGPRLRKVG